VISQSGAVCGAIIRWADLKQIGLAKVISIGNKADISEIDLLEALADDEETKVIVVTWKASPMERSSSGPLRR